jgi:hypothetical protein
VFSRHSSVASKKKRWHFNLLSFSTFGDSEPFFM